jgi:hypothetical protein
MRSAETVPMKRCWMVVLLGLGIAGGIFCTPAAALSGGMEKAVVRAMRRVQCTEGQTGEHNKVITALVGAGGDGTCMEYQLHTARVSYVIRPRVAILLKLGDNVYIKLFKDELILHTGQARKDIRCSVLSMRLRGDGAEDKEMLRRPAICLSETGEAVACTADSMAFR